MIVPMRGYSASVWRLIKLRPDGITTPEINRHFNARAKKTYNAVKYLTRLKLITMTHVDGTLNRYYPKRQR